MNGVIGIELADRVITVVPETPCANCSSPICARQEVAARILTGSRVARCGNCLSRELGHPLPRLTMALQQQVSLRECHRRDLREATCQGTGDCWVCRVTLPVGVETPPPTLNLDADEAGCGDLMVLLARGARTLEPGQEMLITARDPSAKHDIPSWCRLTGHRLLAAGLGPENAGYRIQKSLPPQGS